MDSYVDKYRNGTLIKDMVEFVNDNNISKFSFSKYDKLRKSSDTYREAFPGKFSIQLYFNSITNLKMGIDYRNSSLETILNYQAMLAIESHWTMLNSYEVYDRKSFNNNRKSRPFSYSFLKDILGEWDEFKSSLFNLIDNDKHNMSYIIDCEMVDFIDFIYMNVIHELSIQRKYKEDKDVINRKTYYVRCALEDDIFYLYINSMLGLKCRELGDGKIEVKVLDLKIDRFAVYNECTKWMYPLDIINYMINIFIIKENNDIFAGWSR